jgi:hypothetical protein
MNWPTWAAVLIAWPVVGFIVAYLIGCGIRRGRLPRNADGLISPVVSYLRPRKRARIPVCATEEEQREAAGGHREH